MKEVASGVWESGVPSHGPSSSDGEEVVHPLSLLRLPNDGSDFPSIP